MLEESINRGQSSGGVSSSKAKESHHCKTTVLDLLELKVVQVSRLALKITPMSE